MEPIVINIDLTKQDVDNLAKGKTVVMRSGNFINYPVQIHIRQL